MSDRSWPIAAFQKSSDQTIAINPSEATGWMALVDFFSVPQVPDLILLQLRVIARSIFIGTGDKVNRLPR